MAGEAMFLAHLISKLTHRDNTSTSTYSKFIEYIYSSFDDIAMNVSNDCEFWGSGREVGTGPLRLRIGS